MIERETVTVDWTDEKSIQQAERRKQFCENEGMVLVNTQRIGLERFVLTYEKPLKENS